ELLGGGRRKAERADLALRGVILLAELLGGVHARLGVRGEEREEVVALDEVQLRRLDRLGGDLVRLAEDRGAGAEDLARLGDLDDQRLPLGRRRRQLRPPAAKNEEDRKSVV